MIKRERRIRAQGRLRPIRPSGPAAPGGAFKILWLKLGIFPLTPPPGDSDTVPALGEGAGRAPGWEGGLLHSSTCQDSDELNFLQLMIF